MIVNTGSEDQLDITIENDGSYQLTGTRLKVGNVEIPHLSTVMFEHRAGKTALVTAEIHAIGEFSIRLPAEVRVNVMMFPGFEFEIDENQTDKPGGVVYTVREKRTEE